MICKGCPEAKKAFRRLLIDGFDQDYVGIKCMECGAVYEARRKSTFAEKLQKLGNNVGGKLKEASTKRW